MAGADGCRGGWVVALFPSGVSGRRPGLLRLAASFDEVLSLEPRADVLAVDIPSGIKRPNLLTTLTSERFSGFRK